MIDTEKYEGLIDEEGRIDYDGLLLLIRDRKRLQKRNKKLELRFHRVGFGYYREEWEGLLAEVERLRGDPEVNCCPTCGSSDITIYDSFVDSGSHKVICEADGCGSRWFEIWRHVGIEMIEGDDNR